MVGGGLALVTLVFLGFLLLTSRLNPRVWEFTTFIVISEGPSPKTIPPSFRCAPEVLCAIREKTARPPINKQRSVHQSICFFFTICVKNKNKV